MGKLTALCVFSPQALLANMSAMYAVYHGPDGLREKGMKLHNLTLLLAEGKGGTKI